MPLSHHAARTWTLVASAGAVVAFLLAIGVFMMPSPKVRVNLEDAASTVAGGAVVPKEPSNPAEGIDTAWTDLTPEVLGLETAELRRWAEAKNAPKPEETEDATELAKGDTSAPAAGGFAPPWKYLGAVASPSGLTALVVIDGRQRFIQKGYQSPDGFEVRDVGVGEIVVTRGRGEFKIQVEQTARGEALLPGAAVPILSRGSMGGAQEMVNDGSAAAARRRRAAEDAATSDAGDD